MVKQAQKLIFGVEYGAVKEGIDKTSRTLHPTKAQALIKERVKSALTNLNKFKPFKLEISVTTEIRSTHENEAARASWFPGAKRNGERTVV